MKEIQALVIMLSNTASDQFRQMTSNALTSMFKNGDPDSVDMRCVLVETNTDSPAYDIDNVLTIYPSESFNYNRFMNLGYKAAKDYWPEFFDENSTRTDNQNWNTTKYVVLANNDLYFHENWAWELATAIDECGYDSVSPYAPGWAQHNHFEVGYNYEGWGIGHEFAGWCQMYKHSSFEKLYPLDEAYLFWCADNSMVMEMSKLEMVHALATNSRVTHFTSSSHKLIPPEKQYEWTTGMGEILNKKIAEGKYKNG